MSFGGMLSSIHGQPGLINGRKTSRRSMTPKGVAAGLLTPGHFFLVGGIVPLALPGEAVPKRHAANGYAKAELGPNQKWCRPDFS